MAANWHFHVDVYAPFGASEATGKSLTSNVRVGGTQVRLGFYLAHLLVGPFSKLDVPFGIAALGWCQDAANLETVLMPLLEAAVRVPTPSGEQMRIVAVGDELQKPFDGAYGVAYGYPFADMTKAPPADDLAPANAKLFDPIIDECVMRLIRFSARVDPMVFLLAGIGRTGELVVQAVAEAKALLMAATTPSQAKPTEGA